MYDPENWTLRKMSQKCPGRFHLRCPKKLEKIICDDRVKNEALHRAKKGRNILHAKKRKKAKWIGHTLHRNCFLKHLTE